ncbi:hypothetical protein SKUN_00763 [Spiroplasma kunkelii CR2-3x]|uniref:Uncharacterized protein n=1 Tax=Spiroplasma kunkelii CR2-3x TaxID=273035 RepID=A0A0K2JGD6_SPIKU|nr:hypothetical protein [Spiroplasma kunkelii]ALA97654.1 hypothetical protein SKUN_00763 [Spiroplasma kunkelii CR2-3x]
MANKDEKKFYKTSFFICSSFIFGPLGALISWLILKFQKNKKLKNKQNEEQLLENLALLKNNNLENDDSKEKINNQKLVEFYKNILAEFDTLFSKQSKDMPDVKNKNTQTTVVSNQILEQSKTNDLLGENMKVKNNLRKVEPRSESVTKTNDLLGENMKVKNNLRKVEPRSESVIKTNDLLGENMKVKNNLRKVEPRSESVTKTNDLLGENMKVKNNLRKVEPRSESVIKTNDLLGEIMRVKNNLRKVEPRSESVTKTNDLLGEIMKVKNNLRKVEPKPRSFTNRIIPNPTIKPNLSNWQKEQIKSINEQLNSIEHENENNKNIDENTI